MITPEWSHKIEAERIGADHFVVTIKATEQESRDVARRLKVEKIEDLSARFVLSREKGGFLIAVQGQASATVTQSCVITQEPLINEVIEDIEAFYTDKQDNSTVSFAKARHERLGKTADAELPILDEREDPEPVIDGSIDLGELAVQFLSLGVDPYPQKEGALSEYVQKETVRSGAPQTHNPFKALKEWKAQQDKD